MLAGGIAHDFNNLLTSVITFSGFARDALPVDDARRADLDQALVAAGKAVDLTRQLLIFSRRTALELAPIDLNEAIAQIGKLLRRTLGEDIDLVIESATPSAGVLADSSCLDQLLVNLAVNARDAMPRGGRLTLSVASVAVGASHSTLEPGRYVKLEVSDTGEGMTPAVADRVFEPFYTTKGPDEGTGLGLATCYGIATQLGGTIDLRTEPGAGATFTVYLPQTDLAAESGEQPRAIVERANGHARILLVEDDASVREAARRMLEGAGFEVSMAADFPAALDAIHALDSDSHDIDLLLSDVVLPHGNGYDLAQALKKKHPEIPTLLTSGYALRGQQGVVPSEALRTILVKPYTKASLLSAVRERLKQPPDGGGGEVRGGGEALHRGVRDAKK